MDFFSDSIREYVGTLPLSEPDFANEDVFISSFNDTDLVARDVAQLLSLTTPVNRLDRSNLQGGTTGTLLYNCLNELVRQTYLPPKHFFVMTPLGVEFILKARPIDILFQYLKAPPEDIFDLKELHPFIESFGITETCSMLLEIICNSDMEYYINDIVDQKMRENYFAKVSEPYRGKTTSNQKSNFY
jgi:hypothetical protein